MSKAKETNTTSRRAVVRGALTAAAAVVFSSATLACAHVAPGADDAEILRLCEQIQRTCDRQDALFKVRVTIADERRTEADLERITAELDALTEKLWEAGTPDTDRGARAMARVALRMAGDGGDCEIILADEAQSIAIDVLRYFARLDA